MELKTMFEGIKTFADFSHEEIPPQEWIVDELIPANVCTLFNDEAGVGKSTITQQMLMSVSVGEPFLGYETVKCPTLFVTCEDDEDVIRRRGVLIAKQLGYELQYDFPDFHLKSLVETVNTLLTDEEEECLEMLINTKGIRLFLLDLITDFHDKDENARQEVNKFVKGQMAALARRTNCAFIMLAHPSKAGTATGDGTSGSTSWEGSVRQRLYLKKNRSNIHQFKVAKSNYGREFYIGDVKQVNGVFVFSDQERPPDDELKSKYQRTFLELIPPEGVCHVAHREDFDNRHRGQTKNISKEYGAAKKRLFSKKLINDQNGEFHRFTSKDDPTDNQITNNLNI
ncbi:AAA family ATPase [Luminiphilus sp.]|nr:AAA family ATPase [Luminiphilus sp.]